MLSTLAKQHSGKIVTLASLGSALALAYWSRARALKLAKFSEKWVAERLDSSSLCRAVFAIAHLAAK